MAQAVAGAVVSWLGLTGVTAAVAGAAVEVGLYAGLHAVVQQNTEQKQQGGLIDLQLNSAAPRQLVIGKRMTGGVLVDWYLAGNNNTKLYLPIYLSEGPCGQITRVFADGRPVWTTPLVHGVRTTIPDFRSGGDRLWLTYYDGRVGQTADPTLVGLSQGWTSANKMTGCAWVLVECQWDSDNMRSPPSLSFEMEGAKLYDRRKDSTAGGAGAHRINDPSTWEWSDNPMVALDHFLLGRYWNGRRTFGIGLSADEVPYSYFAAQANICDEDVALKAGGTQKRYRANGFILADEEYASTITKLCTAMAARPADFGGRFGVIGVESKTPVMTIDDTDLIAGVQEVYTPKRSWSDLVGEVEGRFQDPAQLYQPTPYPNVSEAEWAEEDGGEPKVFTLDLEFETDVERAQRLALLKARAERRQATLTGVYPLRAVELERGDWFIRTGEKWGEGGKTFEVIERVLDPATWTVSIVAQEVDPSDSAWDESVAKDGPPVPLDPTDTLADVEVPSITVTAVTLSGAGSTIPAIKVAWTSPTDPRVRHFYVEVENVDGVTPKTVRSVLLPVDTPEVIIQDGIVDGDSYAVSAKFLTDTIPSGWCVAEIVAAPGTYAVGAASSVPWSGVTGAGKPQDNATVGARAGTNLYRSDGSTVMSQAEVRTAEGTAAGIAGQGALATLSFVTIGTNLRRADGSTTATESHIVTSLGTAAAITGQGWGATASESQASNAQVPAGANGLVDTSFRWQSTYWAKGQTSGSTAFSVETSTQGLRKSVVTGASVTTGSGQNIHTSSQPQLAHFPCKENDRIAARALVGSQNLGSVELLINYRNAAGSVISSTTATVVSSGLLAGTGEEATFNELTNSGVAPANTACATIQIIGRTPSTAAPVLRIAKPLLARVPDSQTAVPLYSPGREHEIGANVTETRTAAGIAGQGALATLSSVTGAYLAAGAGKNILVDTDFRFGATYWQTATQSGSASLSVSTSTNGIRRAVVTGAGLSVGHYIDLSSLPQWNEFPCLPGERVEASAYLGGSNVSSVKVIIDFRDSSGNNTGYSSEFTDSTPSAGNGDLTTFERVYGFATAPANTVKARVVFRGIASSSAPVLNVAKPYFGKASAGQTEPTPWMHGVDGELGANVTETRTAAGIAGQGALATKSSVGNSDITANAIMASRLYLTDLSNLLRDSELLDSSYWATLPAGSTFNATDTSVTNLPTDTPVGMGLSRAIKFPDGDGTTTLRYYIANPTNANLTPVEPGRSYRGGARFYASAGCTMRGYMQITWLKRDLSNSSTATSQVGAAFDYRTTAAAADTVGDVSGIVTAPADAVYARIQLIAMTSTTQANAGHVKVGLARFQRAASTELIPNSAVDYTKLSSTAVRLGTNIVRNDGSTSVTDTMVVTSLGTASAITGQGSLATANFVLFNSTVRLQDGTTVVTDAMVVTSSGTAAAIAGQGNFATNNFYVQSGEPSSPQNGWWWADTTSNVLKVRVSGAWTTVADITPAGGVDPDLQTFTKAATITNATTSGATATVMAQIDVNNVGSGGYIGILLGDATSQLGTYLIPAAGCDVSDGGTWDGKVQLTEQLQSGGTEYVLGEWGMEVEDLGSFCAINWDAGSEPWPTPPMAQNLSGNVRYRLKLVRVSGSNNVTGNGISGKVYIQRTPG